MTPRSAGCSHFTWNLTHLTALLGNNADTLPQRALRLKSAECAGHLPLPWDGQGVHSRQCEQARFQAESGTHRCLNKDLIGVALMPAPVPWSSGFMEHTRLL